MMKKALILCSMAAIAALGQCQSLSAKAANKLLYEDMDAEIAKMKASGSVDYDKAHDVAVAKMEAVLKNVDLDKVDPSDAYDWAVLYQGLGDSEKVCKMAKLSISSGPDKHVVFKDQIILLMGLRELGNTDELKQVWLSAQPSTPQELERLYVDTAFTIDAICTKEGPAASLALLDQFQKDHAAAHDLKSLESDMEANPPYPFPKDKNERRKALERIARVNYFDSVLEIGTEQADLLRRMGDRKGATAILQKCLDEIPADQTRFREQVSETITRFALMGTPAPELALEQNVGAFTSLRDLKGKVVLLDFFAHWCHPCMMSTPGLASLYSETHAQGLEIVGVTEYYGYFKEHQHLSKKDELADLKGLMTEKGIVWPVAIGPHANRTTYGVFGIPTLVLVGKDGVIRDTWVGFTPSTETLIKRAVDKALAE